MPGEQESVGVEFVDLPRARVREELRLLPRHFY